MAIKHGSDITKRIIKQMKADPDRSFSEGADMAKPCRVGRTRRLVAKLALPVRLALTAAAKHLGNVSNFTASA
jgi:hypothetical protein